MDRKKYTYTIQERAYSKRYAREHKEKGLCTNCCSLVASGKTKCQKHLDFLALYNKKHRIALSKAAVIRNRTRSYNNTLFILEYLSEHPCVDCGETDPLVLDFDHLDRSIKSYSISSVMKTGDRSKITSEIQKCSVRCANCHRRRTAKQLNTLKYKILSNETR